VGYNSQRSRTDTKGAAVPPSFPAAPLAFIEVALGLLDGTFLIGCHAIDPSRTDWLKRDPAVFQSRREFLRRQHLAVPPTWVLNLDFRCGVSAAYFDVVPPIAVRASAKGGATIKQ
jgi:hypothetical protein